MEGENETVEDIVKEMHRLSRATNRNGLNVKDDPLRTVRKSASAAVHMFANRIEAAHKREIAELKTAYNRAVSADVHHAMEVEHLLREVAELRECLEVAIRMRCTNCGMCTRGAEPCYPDGAVFGPADCWMIMKWKSALEGANDGQDD